MCLSTPNPLEDKFKEIGKTTLPAAKQVVNPIHGGEYPRVCQHQQALSQVLFTLHTQQDRFQLKECSSPCN